MYRLPFLRLEIHSWGGLGSQLFALALAFDIQIRNQRKIRIVVHTSGVTRRAIDIQLFGDFFDLVQIEDFARKSVSTGSSKSLFRKHKLVHYIRRFFEFLHLLKFDYSINNLGDIKPWTMQLRGTYSQRVISGYSLEKISKKILQGLTFDSNKNLVTNEISLHYRLGDLIDMETKTPVDAHRLVDFILKNQSRWKITNINLSSDSPIEAKKRLKRLFDSSEFAITTLSSTPLETIRSMIQSSVFVGTGSKISYWIILLRFYTDARLINALPIEHREEISQLLEKKHADNIQYF